MRKIIFLLATLIAQVVHGATYVYGIREPYNRIVNVRGWQEYSTVKKMLTPVGIVIGIWRKDIKYDYDRTRGFDLMSKRIGTVPKYMFSLNKTLEQALAAISEIKSGLATSDNEIPERKQLADAIQNSLKDTTRNYLLCAYFGNFFLISDNDVEFEKCVKEILTTLNEAGYYPQFKDKIKNALPQFKDSDDYTLLKAYFVRLVSVESTTQSAPAGAADAAKQSWTTWLTSLFTAQPIILPDNQENRKINHEAFDKENTQYEAIKPNKRLLPADDIDRPNLDQLKFSYPSQDT